MRIKGTFLSDYVELVNDNPDLDWDSYLTESDWEVVRNTIIPTEWYPVEVMGNIGRGIFDMRSKRNYELVRLHGRARATDAYDDATRKFLEKGDPVASLKAYSMIAGRYIDELKVTLEKSGPTEAYVCFFPVEEAPSWDLFREIQAGRRA